MHYLGLSLAWRLPAFDLREAMARIRVQFQPVKFLQSSDPFERSLAERALSVKCVKDDSFQKIAQREVMKLGQCLEHFQQALFNPHAGLDALNQEWFVL